MATPPDDRLPLVRAYQRATRGVTIAVGMVAPGLLGYWLDQKLGTRALLTILGFGIGMAFGVWELVRLSQVRPLQDKSEQSERDQEDERVEKGPR